MSNPTTDDIVQLLAKFAHNSPDMSYMTEELKEGLHQLVDHAFARTFPDPLDERNHTERAAAGFALGFSAGRDYEQTLTFSQQFNEPTMCQWFALCDREATTTVKHPVLGDVPCCDRCAELATGR